MANSKHNMQLDETYVLEALASLERRIQDRFPESGLLQTCAQFQILANESQEDIQEIKKMHLPLRIMTISTISIGLLAIFYGLSLLDWSINKLSFSELLPLAEATINDLVLLGAAIFFLVTLELRFKRSRVLALIDKLRGLAHIIDMHQLTKDPTMIGLIELETLNSPKRTLSKFEMQRYLDYCSELLSLIGKIAALYAQKFPDEVIMHSVNEVETLCSGFSQKIWQKIMIVSQMEDKLRLSTKNLKPQE